MQDIDVALAMLDNFERNTVRLLDRIREQRRHLLDDARRDAVDILAARAERDPAFSIDRRDVREWEIDERAVQRRRVHEV